jgi:hypothetical protein
MNCPDYLPLSDIKFLTIRRKTSTSRLLLIDRVVDQIASSSSHHHPQPQPKHSNHASKKNDSEEQAGEIASRLISLNDVETQTPPMTMPSNKESTESKDQDDAQGADEASEQLPLPVQRTKKSSNRILHSISYKNKDDLKEQVTAYMNYHKRCQENNLVEKELNRPEAIERMNEYRRATSVEDEQWRQLRELKSFRQQLLRRIEPKTRKMD